MVVQEHTLYAVSAGIGLLATVVFLLRGRKYEGATGRYMLLAPFVTGALTVGYLIMALDMLVTFNPDGEPVYFSRYLMYTLTYPYLIYYLGVVSNASYRYRVIGAVGVLGFTYGTLVAQWMPEPVSSIAGLLSILIVALLVWMLFRPYTTPASSVSGDRRLMFSKIRNLFVLLFISYLLLAFMSRQALGFYDAFVGVFISSYIDLLGHIGAAGLILYSRNAVAEIAREEPSPLRLLRASQQVSPTQTEGDGVETDD